MQPLIESLHQLLIALGDLLVNLGSILVPLIPLAIWIAYWSFGVNWVKLRAVILQGGWVGIVLLGLLAVLVWGSVAPPPSGSHHFLGLTLSNFVGKTVFVSTLVCIAFLCGSVQLSGSLGGWANFDEPVTEIGFRTGAHDHDSHESGHGASSHDASAHPAAAHH